MNEPNQFLLYTAPGGAVKVDVFFKSETVWLTQKALAELFGVKIPAINKHLKNIFESGELDAGSAISILETTAADGKNYQTRYYNLDAIIAVGYRVNSYQATQFRIWATTTLREFIIKGFVMDDERLKPGKRVLGKDYFDELLERIREIRASERRFYQKITDIYALSLDYSADAPLTKEFFATFRQPMEENRLLFLSPFAYGNPCRPSVESCSIRNGFVLAFAKDRYLPHGGDGMNDAPVLSTN